MKSTVNRISTVALINSTLDIEGEEFSNSHKIIQIKAQSEKKEYER